MKPWRKPGYKLLAALEPEEVRVPVVIACWQLTEGDVSAEQAEQPVGATHNHPENLAQHRGDDHRDEPLGLTGPDGCSCVRDSSRGCCFASGTTTLPTRAAVER